MPILQEFRSSVKEFKREIERDMMIRRYQKWQQGQVPVEDLVVDFMAKTKAQVVTSWRSAVKGTLDFALSFLVIGALSPLMLVIAIAIKMTSKGPILYRQTRVGKREKLFHMLKFRTMVENAEASTGPIWAQKNDPRITPIGSFLRRSHLDELPQLFNVLKGDMSLVGPRPERPYFVNEFRNLIPNYELRLCAKPGITGLAQIKRRYDETLADVRKKLRYDLLYVQRMCPLLDIKVIALTILAVILRTGR